MKKLFPLILLFVLTAPVSSRPAKSNFDDFWRIFRTAVINQDKTAVADLTKFPLAMPYGVDSVKSRASFIRNYSKIMNREADSVRCFEKNKPQKEDDKTYAIYCSFKSEPEGTGSMPIRYGFEATKTGWRFVGLDNVNE